MLKAVKPKKCGRTGIFYRRIYNSLIIGVLIRRTNKFLVYIVKPA